MVPMTSASGMLLADAAATFSRQLKSRPQTDLAIVFADWTGAMPGDHPEARQVISAASARTGVQQDFQTVAAIGFAFDAGLLDTSQLAALKQGIERQIGRQPFIDEVPMPFCSDAVGLLGIALGTRKLADTALSERVICWLRGFLRKIYELDGTEDWQRCLFDAADYVLGGKIGLPPVASEQAADVRAMLAARSILPGGERSEQEEMSVYRLLAASSTVQLSYEHAAIRLSALNWLTRSSPSAVPGRMTMEGLVRLLERIPAGLRNWTWEDKPRTPTSTARQWHIDNEYHVQNLLSLVLAPIFPDLDDEQYLTKIGQKNPRADFHIPSMKDMVEAKFFRSVDKPQKMIDEIAADASLYCAMGNECVGVIAVIWDDAGRSHEHDYMKQGLKKLPGVIDAIVISRPGDWK